MSLDRQPIVRRQHICLKAGGSNQRHQTTEATREMNFESEAFGCSPPMNPRHRSGAGSPITPFRFPLLSTYPPPNHCELPQLLTSPAGSSIVTKEGDAPHKTVKVYLSPSQALRLPQLPTSPYVQSAVTKDAPHKIVSFYLSPSRKL
jgi:hypothetical protein